MAAGHCGWRACRHDLARFEGPGSRLINCEGGAVLPGINDAHCHPLAHAVALLSVDCAPESVEDIAGIGARRQN